MNRRKSLSTYRSRSFVIGCLFVLTAILAGLFGRFFKPVEKHELLSALHETSFGLDYELIWNTFADGRAIPEGKKEVHERILKSALTGQYKNIPGFEISDEGRKRLEATQNPYRQEIRFKSHINPVLDNGGFTALNLQTDRLVLSLDPEGRISPEKRIERVEETVRIIQSQFGPQFNYIETLKPPSVLYAGEAGLHEPIGRIAGINYYPASSPWHKFWTVFDEQEIRDDLDRIAELGANTIRIFLYFKVFEDPATRDVSLKRLSLLLDWADERGLQVIPTCFDMGANYDLVHFGQNWTHLNRILNATRDHPAIAYFDLKNEADRDYKYFDKKTVDLWLAAMLTIAKSYYPDRYFTISWSNTQAAAALIDSVDIVSSNDYGDPQTLGQRLATLKEKANGKPVILSEIGHSRWGPMTSARVQTKKLKKQLAHIGNIDGVLVWTLNDFDEVPSQVAGWQPWRKAMQAHYGLAPESAAEFKRFTTLFLTTSPLQDNQL